MDLPTLDARLYYVLTNSGRGFDLCRTSSETHWWVCWLKLALFVSVQYCGVLVCWADWRLNWKSHHSMNIPRSYLRKYLLQSKNVIAFCIHFYNYKIYSKLYKYSSVDTIAVAIMNTANWTSECKLSSQIERSCSLMGNIRLRGAGV